MNRDTSTIARPILFSSEMVRALLAGSKTQTRRVIDPQPDEDGLARKIGAVAWQDTSRRKYRCRFGNKNDLLWVREAAKLRSVGPDDDELTLIYKADDDMGQGVYDFRVPAGAKRPYFATRHTPGIHMPRWASRLTLRITDVRVQRLQEITEDDAAEEGIIRITRSIYRHGRMDGFGIEGTKPEDAHTTRTNAFAHLWDSINAARGYGWNTNPWIWAISFQVIRANVDRVLKEAA